MNIAAPALLLDELPVRYRIAFDAQGSRIDIGINEAAVRPSSRGVINHWMHDSSHNPEEFRDDVDLLKAVIKKLIKPHERYVFKGMRSSRRTATLETICDLANEIVQENKIDDWIGRDRDAG